MKFLYAIFIAASAVFLALSPVGLLIGFSIRDLQADVQKREAELQTMDEKIEEQRQAIQGTEEKKVSQEREIYALQKNLKNEQQALQAQQVQIEKGSAISQRVWPSLLRDMAAAALTDEKMKALLTSHGYK